MFLEIALEIAFANASETITLWQCTEELVKKIISLTVKSNCMFMVDDHNYD